MSNKVTIKFADGNYTFGFGLDEIEELQRKCSSGFGTIIARVMDGGWYSSDISETIRIGLIGSGEVPPTKAKELVDFYVNPLRFPLARPGDPSAPLNVAKVILGSVMFGIASDEDKKPQGEGEAGTTDTLTSPPSEQQPSEPGWTPSASVD